MKSFCSFGGFLPRRNHGITDRTHASKSQREIQFLFWSARYLNWVISKWSCKTYRWLIDTWWCFSIHNYTLWCLHRFWKINCHLVITTILNMEKDHFYFLRDNHQALFTSLKHLYSHLNCREVYFNEAIYEYPCTYWSLWKSENRKIITHAPVLNFCLECYYVKQNALVIYCCNEERASKPIYHDTQWQTVICLGMMKACFPWRGDTNQWFIKKTTLNLFHLLCAWFFLVVQWVKIDSVFDFYTHTNTILSICYVILDSAPSFKTWISRTSQCIISFNRSLHFLHTPTYRKNKIRLVSMTTSLRYRRWKLEEARAQAAKPRKTYFLLPLPCSSRGFAAL